MLKIWWVLFAMSRPLQLLAVTAVYLIGVAIAVELGYGFDWSTALWGYAALIPTSASIHYANEYADYETDALTTRTPFSGGSGALPRTGLSRRWALRGAWVSLLIGGSVALVGVLIGLMNLAALGVLAFGAFFGWMYSLPPLALAWRGWGELDNAMLGGVALPVYGYAVLAEQITLMVIAICLPFGGLVFINLLATTWPDRAADAEVGKNTLATRWSLEHLRLVYRVAAMGAVGVLVANIAFNGLPPLVGLGSVLVLPLVIWGHHVYTRQESPFPTVAAMVLLMNVYLVGWGVVALNLL